jgi:hypothetical protein
LPLSADYTHMRCLYCAKELALLKRLTGGGEFCSEAHKQSYQEEYNRLALSRLMQAQTKTGDKAASQNASPRPPEPVHLSAPVAVAEPSQVEEPVMVGGPAEEPEAEDAFYPPEAGFSLEIPTLCVLPDGMPYVEPWMESRVELATPTCLFENGQHTLSAAEPVRVEILPRMWDKAQDGTHNATPLEFDSGKVDLSMPVAVKSSHDIPTAGPVDLDFPPKAPETNRSLSLSGPVSFRFEVVTKNSTLWERPQTAIEYSADDADVVFPDVWEGFTSATSVDGGTDRDRESAPEPESDRTPRAALEALSRLHQNMVAEQTLREPAKEQESLEQASISPQIESEEPELVPVLVGAEAQEIESPVAIEAPAANDAQPIPSGSSDLLEIPLKSFPPSASTLAVQTQALTTLQQPTLPRMKALPLRPKVALAPVGYSPQPQVPSAPPPKNPVTDIKLRSGTNIPIPPRGENRPKPVATAKTPVQPQKPAQVAPPQKSQKPAPPVKSPQAATTAQTQAPTVNSPVTPAPASMPKTPSTSSTRDSKVPPSKTETPQQRGKPEAQPSSTPDQPTLTFETLQLQLMANQNTSSQAASLKSKLVIAAVLVVMLAIVAYFVFGKKHKPVVANADQVELTAGPSIMMGEGGWVQGWGGDPLNAHVGRQITIYRPSLNLSDYRIEFQGQIDTKSLGWVFRAADANNYYALKLAIVVPGPTPRMALIKYVVRSGRETEVGRVSLNIPAHNDTIFNVRTDVRGPKYNTYVQGQPVDVWTDDQLRSGGVGFLNERTERARIKTVSIAYLTGGTK